LNETLDGRNLIMTIALVVLTYNEADGLSHYLPLLSDGCHKYGVDRIFAVDGGSTDGSLELFQEYNLPYIIQEIKGRGEAFKLAFEKSDEDALIFFSPDGNENIDDVGKFRGLLAQGADLVIASRMMRGAHNEEDDQVLRWRKWANQAFGLAANLFFRRQGPYITDTINGFRAITRQAWQCLDVSASDYCIEYQSTIRAFKRRLQIAEFPTCEGQRLGGESYAKSIPTGIKFLKLLWQEIIAK